MRQKARCSLKEGAKKIPSQRYRVPVAHNRAPTEPAGEKSGTKCRGEFHKGDYKNIFRF